MKKQLLFFLAVIISCNCYSQVSFEKGYYIDSNKQKINCFIKDMGWRSNPTEFEYKLSENGEIKKATLKSVQEFGINNILKYVRSTVNIDRSSENINNLSYEKNPEFQQEELFLKVLVAGKATLYQYIDDNLIRYFYSKENTDIKQLIFKSYRIDENNIGKNNQFRQQLWGNLKCPKFKLSKIENIRYKKNDLVRFFTEYNKCHDDKEFVNFDLKPKRDLFHLTIRPRINRSSLKTQNTLSDFKDTDFGNKFGFGFGIEAEFILPYNKNKWAIAIEPTYQRFKSEKTIKSSNKITAKINYSSIEFPISLRHYFFLKNNSKIFINVSYILDLSSKSSIEFSGKYKPLEIKTRTNMAFGIGYKKNDRYSLELRYQTNREILSDYTYWNSEYGTLSIVFGYSLF